MDTLLLIRNCILKRDQFKGSPRPSILVKFWIFFALFLAISTFFSPLNFEFSFQGDILKKLLWPSGILGLYVTPKSVFDQIGPDDPGADFNDIQQLFWKIFPLIYGSNFFVNFPVTRPSRDCGYMILNSFSWPWRSAYNIFAKSLNHYL